MSDSPQYVYDILVDYHTQVPRCERVAIRKVTDKLIVIDSHDGNVRVTNYRTHVFKTECVFTEAEAWRRYLEGLRGRKAHFLDQTREIDDAIVRAEDAQERTTA